MHPTVTTTSTPTTSYLPTNTDNLLSPINLTNRNNNIKLDTLTWPDTHENTSNGEATVENWHRTTSNESTPSPLSAIRRAQSTALQNVGFTSNMPTRTVSENNSSKPEATVLSPDSSGAQANGTRWRFNGTGQLVDSEATAAEWDLADEIVRLGISEVVTETGDDGRGQIRTPPQSKIAATTVLQLNEASPLDSSDASADSPPTSDHQINISHSRGSSIDTTVSSSQDSALSSASHTMLAPSQTSLSVDSSVEVKERPHSFSGGLSSAELRRLQQAGVSPLPTTEAVDAQGTLQQQWHSPHNRESVGSNERQFTPESQLTYPSLTQHSVPRQQPVDYRTAQAASPAQAHVSDSHRDEPHVDYHVQQRNFSHLPGHIAQGSSAPPPFVNGRPNNTVTGLPFRQPPRSFPQQGFLPSPTSLGYPGSHHTAHLSLGNTQQLYDMMMPGHETHHPAVARVQQQHNVFPRTHQHSASDPSALREAATLMLTNNMQAFPTPANMLPSSMAPPVPTAMSIYPNQYYPGQDPYPRTDVATAQAMAAGLQSQYTGPYGAVPGQNISMEGGIPQTGASVGPSSPSDNGPSLNNRKLGLYKTELCRSWEEKGSCRYATKCQFAHGEEELRKVARHPKYKTEICRTFWVSGSCPYGKRCCFIHTELPASGGPPGSDNAPPPPRSDGRERSLSTNSDPNDASVSLLARISAKRSQDAGNPNRASTPVDTSPPANGFQFNARPPSGSLRVDTSTLDNAAPKQNKSAYPSFASNGLLHPAPEPTAQSPVPVTAGPDLGRQRLEIVGYNQQQRLNKTSANPNLRHSFNGTEVELNFTTPPPSASVHSSFSVSSPDGSSNSNGSHAPRTGGHSRSGSAGNWGSISRSSNLAATSYPRSSSPTAEVNMNAPWSTSELAVGSSRLNEKAWV